MYKNQSQESCLPKGTDHSHILVFQCPMPVPLQVGVVDL